jgi:FkbM family methyltransferase
MIMIINKLSTFYSHFKVVVRARATDYSFSFEDIFLYLRFAESPGHQEKFPTMNIIEVDGKFKKIVVGSVVYYWPSQFPIEGLAWMYQEVFESSKTNAHAYEFGQLRIRQGDIVIDAGACEGFFTRYALDKGATVIAIEPIKALSEALEKTFADEGIQKRVSVINAAVGSTRKTGRIAKNDHAVFESHLDDAGIDVVDIIKIDDIETSKIDVIKMDIEGGEVDALLGAREIIMRDKPKLSIAVYHEYENAKDIIRYLREIRPDYSIMHRGIFSDGRQHPRPMMVYAW